MKKARRPMTCAKRFSSQPLKSYDVSEDSPKQTAAIIWVRLFDRAVSDNRGSSSQLYRNKIPKAQQVTHRTYAPFRAISPYNLRH